MIFRYDFGKTFELTNFKKHSVHYMNHMPSVSFHLFLNNYKLIFDVNKDLENKNYYNIDAYIFELSFDSDGAVTNGRAIVPMLDTRFKEIKEISSLYLDENENIIKGEFTDTVTQSITDRMCRILKIMHKFDKLKVFI